MSLSTRLAAPPAPKPTKSGLEAWLASLTEKDREAVLAAITNHGWEHADLLRELTSEGAPAVSVTTFGSRRRERGYRGTR